MTGMDLIEFYTARLDEIEAEANRLEAGYEQHGTYGIDLHEESGYPSLPYLNASKAYVLADIAAKRRILAEHVPEGSYVYTDDGTPACGTCGDYTVAWPCLTLQLLAEVFAGHEDYREEWRL